MFQIGLSVLAAMAAIALLSVLSAAVAPKRVDGVDIYVLPWMVRLVVVLALVLWEVFVFGLMIPTSRNPDYDRGLAIGITAILLWFVVFAFRLRVTIDKTDLRYRGIFNHVIALTGIEKIVLIRGMRTRQAYVYSNTGKRLWLSGYLAGFDDLLFQLRNTCQRSEFVEK